MYVLEKNAHTKIGGDDMGGMGSGRKRGSKAKEVVMANGVPSKICVGPICDGKPASTSEFGKHRSYCLKCDSRIKTLKHEADYGDYKYLEAIRNAKKREKKKKHCEVATNLKELIGTMRNEQKYCYYSGVKLLEKINDPNSWSIDRLDFNAGYTEDNMVLCTTEINKIKGKIEFTLDQSRKKLTTLYGEKKALTIINKILEVIK